MDHPEVENLKIAHILPEFHEGGVERHVLWLSNELAGMGHHVTVITAGGKLEEQLDPEVEIWRLPVHRKNPVTGLYSALKVADRAKREGWDILHAHSRVPAWIAWWASVLTGVPWVATCHAFYSRNAGLIPYKKACELICISESVRDYTYALFPASKCTVIYNCLEPSSYKWKGYDGSTRKFLFVGRLTQKKGITTIIEAFSKIGLEGWTLDVVGDGPLLEQLKIRVFSMEMENKILFHGFQDSPESWMADCSCFLFPSLEEGMGLTLMRAIQMGVPVIASDLPVVRELLSTDGELVSPGDVQAWAGAIGTFLNDGLTRVHWDVKKIPTTNEMAKKVESLYKSVIFTITGRKI